MEKSKDGCNDGVLYFGGTWFDLWQDACYPDGFSVVVLSGSRQILVQDLYYTLSYSFEIFSSSPFTDHCVARRCISSDNDRVLLLTFKTRASYIYRTGVPLPSRCFILYIFFSDKYKY